MDIQNNNINQNLAPVTRPVSRRGGGIGIMDSSVVSSPNSGGGVGTRPGTALRGTTANRAAGTASRLAASTVAPPQTASRQRIGTALGNASNRMADRPLTQHGLSGLSERVGTAGNGISTRQVKDKRYWQAMIQTKIQEIAQEREKLLIDKKNLDREKSAKKMYEKKVKEAAKELTNLQSTLTGMNSAIDSSSSGMSRQQLQNETVVLRERNEKIQEQLEKLFKERQSKELMNREIEHEIEIEKNKINEMILSMSSKDQKRYEELRNHSENLRKQSVEYHDKIDSTVKQKEKMTSSIRHSQSTIEALRLQTKLRELIAKKNTMHNEEMNRLTPAQEREKLINDVRNNNQALASIGRQMKLIEDQLNEKKEMLQQMEQDLEEGNSERHIKYKELRKRDEVMTSFMESFSKNLANEKNNVEVLKNQITYAIEQITVQGINLKTSIQTTDKVMNEKNDLNSHNGLLKEYKKLSIQLKQLQILEKRTITQLNNLKMDENNSLNDIQKYSNLTSLRSEATTKLEELSTILEELRDRKRVTESVVEDMEKRNYEIKENLRANETYRQISHLEEKLGDMIKDNKTLQMAVDELIKEYDFTMSKTEALICMNGYNIILCNEIKNLMSHV